MLHFVSRVAKEYGEAKLLGQEFITALANFNVSTVDKVPFVRMALMCTNLVANEKRVVDGISRLLNKNDLEKLRGNNKVNVTISLEKWFSSAWALADSCVEIVGATAFD